MSAVEHNNSVRVSLDEWLYAFVDVAPSFETRQWCCSAGLGGYLRS
jgi:hypothetical protein